MATESDLITMLNKLLDTFIISVGDRVTKAETAIVELRVVQQDVKKLRDEVSDLANRIGRRLA